MVGLDLRSKVKLISKPRLMHISSYFPNHHINFALDSARKRLSKWCLCFEMTSTLEGKFIVLGIYENIKDTIY